jgi:hypothetical protein
MKMKGRFQKAENPSHVRGPFSPALFHRGSGPMSASGPGCVKTRSNQGCTELFSQLPSSGRSYQCNWFPHRRNRDGNSTPKLNIGVFTQPGSFSTEMGCPHHVRSTPVSDRIADMASGPFRAMSGSERTHSITSSARASSDGGTVNPSAFAVLRLTASWYFVGACAGRLAGFSPLKMRST